MSNLNTLRSNNQNDAKINNKTEERYTDDMTNYPSTSSSNQTNQLNKTERGKNITILAI